MKKKIFLLMLFIVFAAVLGGCQDGKASGNGTEPSGANASSENETVISSDDVTSTDGTPVYGGSIVVGITQDLDSLDPHKVVTAGTREVFYNVYEGLMKPDEDGNLVPAVASDYSVSDDQMTYTFTLREGVKFHNGELVTADDVIYSLKRCAGLLETSDPEVSIESAFSTFTDIYATTADDKAAVVIQLSEPNTELLSYLTTAIVPDGYTTADGAAPGTGPFKFESYAPLQSYVIVKNEDYYIPGIPYLDKVTFKISTDADAAFLEVLSGGIDILPYLTADQAAQLGDDYDVKVGSMALVQALFLNANAEPFDDVNVRKAICYAVDRQAIIDMVAGGMGTICDTGIFPSFKKYYDSSLETYYTQDIEKAKQLLADAGYPNGFSMTITVPSNYKFHVDTAQVLVQQLAAVGITADIKLIEWASWYTDVYQARDYESTIIGLDANLAPSNAMRFYSSASASNFMNFSSAAFDSTFENALNTPEGDEKTAYYKQLQQILTDEVSGVYLQAPANIVAVNKKLGGYTFYPLYVQDMASVYYIAN